MADTTYIPTWSGFLYLAVVLDAWSRRIVGWSMETHLRTELVLDALNMALWRRRPDGVVHHFGPGLPVQVVRVRSPLPRGERAAGDGQRGDCYDNAPCESFFATLECELLDRRRFRTQQDARRAVFEFIEGWYNLRRRHSALGQVSPIEFERRSIAA